MSQNLLSFLRLTIIALTYTKLFLLVMNSQIKTSCKYWHEKVLFPAKFRNVNFFTIIFYIVNHKLSHEKKRFL
jgi:hypothetical protein